MARITINTTSGSDFVQFFRAIQADGGDDETPIITATAKAITIAGETSGDKLVIRGNFATPFPGVVTGTATSAILVDNPGDLTYATFSGFSVDATEFLDELANGTTQDVLNLFGTIQFIGNIGDDVGYGAFGADDLSGDSGNDTLSGFAGNDTVEGGAGADEMHGGAGLDTLSYSGSASKVTVSLKGTAKGGEATGDTFDGFENLTGSAFNDKLTGTNAVNVLNGGAGNDNLRGAGGGDELNGGTGTDTADYTGARGAVTVDLAAGTGSGSDAQSDTFISIENVTGTRFNDVLTGNIAGNALKGAAGNDRLNGGVGNDILIGGAGDDTFVLNNLEASADSIRDYTVGDDQLEISAALFKGGLIAGEPLSDSQLDINDSGDAESNASRFILKTFADDQPAELYFDTNGAKEGGSRLIATISGDLSLFSSSDFLIV